MCGLSLADNFRSLDSNKEKSKEDTEFEQQRQATIAEALQAKEESLGKKFGAGGLKVRLCCLLTF